MTHWQGTHVVSRLRCLVDCHRACNPEKIGLEPQVLAEVDGVAAVQTASCVVPALQLRSSQGSFGDGDALAFSAGHASDKVIANLRVHGVADAEDGHHDVSHHRIGFLSTDAAGNMANGMGARCEG